MCDHCEYMNKIKKEIISDLKVFDYVHNDDFSSLNINDSLKQKLQNSETDDSEDSNDNKHDN